MVNSRVESDVESEGKVKQKVIEWLRLNMKKYNHLHST